MAIMNCAQPSINHDPPVAADERRVLSQLSLGLQCFQVKPGGQVMQLLGG